jgi:hypothetical protein
MGWFIQTPHGGARTATHALTREHMGAFWTSFHGTQRRTRGRWDMYSPIVDVWLDMYVPNSVCQGVGRCTCG